MKAIDIRNENFQTLRSRLDDARSAVLSELAIHGPCTTRQLAEKSRRDILTVRPRITELKDMGLVILEGREGNEGVYRIASQRDWEAWRSAQVEEQTSGQQQLI